MKEKQLPPDFDVRNIYCAPVTPNENLVSRLEQLLSEAKSGELRGLAWICQWRGDQVSSSWSLSQMNARRIIGEIEFLKRDMMEGIE